MGSSFKSDGDTTVNFRTHDVRVDLNIGRHVLDGACIASELNPNNQRSSQMPPVTEFVGQNADVNKMTKRAIMTSQNTQTIRMDV